MLKKLILLCIFCLNTMLLLSQCPIVDAGPDQNTCEIPGNFTLNGSINGTSIFHQWTPSTGLSDPSSLSTTATASDPTMYYLCAKSIDFSTNLIINGDFESGNVSFTTDYTYNVNPTIPGNQLLEGQYSISNNPAPMHINWQACGDHTSGSGNMMLINGHQSANQNAWCQTVNVMPNTEYAFSVWVASVDPNGPSEIQFRINGSPIGTGNVALNTPCVWTNFFVLWNSGSTTSADICIRDLNTIEMGNDFAIDDVIFSPVCTVKDSVLLTPYMMTTNIFNTGPICEGDDIQIGADGGDTYSWVGPNGFTSSANTISLQNATFDYNGLYDVTITGIGGCTDQLSTYVEVYESHEVFDTIPTCNLNEATSYTSFLTNQFGCDSTVYVNVKYFPPSDTIVYSTLCDSAGVGNFTVVALNQYGCDSIITYSVSLAPIDTFLRISYTCDSTTVSTDTLRLTNKYGCDSTEISHVIYVERFEISLDSSTCDPTLAGVFIQNLTSQIGCDSIVTLTIKHIESDTTHLTEGSCDSTKVGTFTTDLSNQFGCDSIVIMNIDLFPSYDISFESFSCTDSLVGLFVKTLSSELGCDSVVTTIIKPLQKDTIFLQSTSCDSTAIGVFSYVNINQFGCDSLVITNVLLDPSNSTYISDSTCDPSQSGLFVKDLINQYGCDSTVYIDVSLKPSDSIAFFDNTCNPLESGIFRQNLKNQYGCDSVIIKNITLNPKDTTYLMSSSCEILDTGLFTEFYTNQFGCDSIILTHISFNPSTEQIINLTTCDSLQVGSVIQTLLNQYGCDSTIITNTTLAPIISVDLSISQLDCFYDDIGAIIVNINSGLPPYMYSLNNGPFQSDNQFENLSSGLYQIDIMDSFGCSKSEMVLINSVNAVSVDLGDDISISIGDSVILKSVINVPLDSLILLDWTAINNIDCPQCPDQVVYPIITTTYSIEVVNTDGCSDQDQLTISVDKTKHIIVPNIFSPNDDGVNDIFMIFGRESEVNKISSFSGFDRWGNKMWSFYDFPINNETFGWNGRFNNSPVNIGVYVWIAQIEFVDGEILNLSGDVTLVR